MPLSYILYIAVSSMENKSVRARTRLLYPIDNLFRSVPRADPFRSCDFA